MMKKKNDRLPAGVSSDEADTLFPETESEEFYNAYGEIKEKQKKVDDYVERIRGDIRVGARPARKRFRL
uniref:Uncharacterized protein n=1 Tax=Candidatus Kentrum sp. MB TaxID=2138164 RepID=A0A450XDB5_9GAMM|nr:MAG: hypothetical protein BECKMB1821G_GA0114241_102636 [Candidatus Kentron sp. MB]VFK31096.1 MAG: hypothetical protein BECKMB1821I_GA0114274_102036 [Candidatus Kentron sp. MB]VFK75518.1 MAG: hypothetical protein BECKMB1821H_GA0114242_102435 [Candidatus Kentron sp. MB]